MVVRRRRKTRKQRGSRTHGRGCAKRGRGSGERGGKGMAGGHKHKWSYIIRYMPDYFGKHGFVPSTKKEISAVNIGEIDEKIEKLVEDGLATKEGNVYRVDIRKLGFSKVLGGGRITHSIEIIADEVSETAKRKIEQAGGRVLSGD
jgi:large subunit ribosomal protein L15